MIGDAREALEAARLQAWKTAAQAGVADLDAGRFHDVQDDGLEEFIAELGHCVKAPCQKEQREGRMLQGRIIVDALWDEEAHVFVATSDDVVGLVTEAETLEELQKKLSVLIPELLELNGDGILSFQDEADLILLSEHRSKVRLRA